MLSRVSCGEKQDRGSWHCTVSLASSTRRPRLLEIPPHKTQSPWAARVLQVEFRFQPSSRSLTVQLTVRTHHTIGRYTIERPGAGSRGVWLVETPGRHLDSRSSSSLASTVPSRHFLFHTAYSKAPGGIWRTGSHRGHGAVIAVLLRCGAACVALCRGPLSSRPRGRWLLDGASQQGPMARPGRGPNLPQAHSTELVGWGHQAGD